MLNKNKAFHLNAHRAIAIVVQLSLIFLGAKSFAVGPANNPTMEQSNRTPFPFEYERAPDNGLGEDEEDLDRISHARPSPPVPTTPQHATPATQTPRSHVPTPEEVQARIEKGAPATAEVQSALKAAPAGAKPKTHDDDTEAGANVPTSHPLRPALSGSPVGDGPTVTAPVPPKRPKDIGRPPVRKSNSDTENIGPWDTPADPDRLGRAEAQERKRQGGEICRTCDPSEFKNPLEALADGLGDVFSKLDGTSFSRQLAKLAPRYSHAESGNCYRGVKNLLYKADPSLRRFFEGNKARYAIFAMKNLTDAGFRNDGRYCNTRGVIRVYAGPATSIAFKHLRKGTLNNWNAIFAETQKYMRDHFKMSAARVSAGDVAGHIEVLGNDDRWHHFTSSREPIDSPSHFGPWRRKLVGCFMK